MHSPHCHQMLATTTVEIGSGNIHEQFFTNKKGRLMPAFFQMRWNPGDYCPSSVPRSSAMRSPRSILTMP